MKQFLPYFSFLLCLIVLCSCTQEKRTKPSKAEPNTTAVNTSGVSSSSSSKSTTFPSATTPILPPQQYGSGHVYTQEDLLQIRDFKGTYQEIVEKYPERYEHSDWYGPCLVYYGETSALKIRFLKETNGIGNVRTEYKNLQPKSKFDTLQVGSTLEEVKNIDPGGDYLFGYISSQSYPPFSTHYTSDGYAIWIYYGDFWHIDEIIVRKLWGAGNGSAG